MRPTTTRSRTALGVSALIALAACGREAPPCAPRADHSIVGCFDGQPVIAAEVGEHLRPIVHAPSMAFEPDPRADAFGAAVKVRVFAAEAVRRKLAGGDGRDARSRAMLHQALIRDEATRAGALPDAIAADQVRALYDDRPGLFNKITGVWVRAIFTASKADAVAAYHDASGLDDAGFADLAKRRSRDPSAANGGDLGEAHADGIDPALRRAANDLRKEGERSPPVPLADGRWVILRATRVELNARPFADAERDVRNHLAHLHERVALDTLYQQLSPRHRVTVFSDELAHLPEPP